MVVKLKLMQSRTDDGFLKIEEERISRFVCSGTLQRGDRYTMTTTRKILQPSHNNH
jgi:hypothetical protein